MRTVFLVFLGIAVSGFGAGLVRMRSMDQCRDAFSLKSQAVLSEEWLKAAAADPFLVPLLTSGPISVYLQELRSRAKNISSSPFSFHLSDRDSHALADFGAADFSDPKGALARLSGLSPWETASCGQKPDLRLLALFQDAETHWQSRRIEVKVAKAEFSHDREIYCLSGALVGRLKKLLAAAEERCLKAAEKKAACDPGMTVSLQEEIADLERQKEFNREKMERKWPVEYIKELVCSSS